MPSQRGLTISSNSDGTFWLASRKIFTRSRELFAFSVVKNVIEVPLVPALPVLPILWM